MSEGNLTTDQRVEEQRLPDECWIWRRPDHHLEVNFTKPPDVHHAVKYMRVLSRQEVERLDNASLRNAVEDLRRERDRAQQHYEIAKAGMLAAREGQYLQLRGMPNVIVEPQIMMMRADLDAAAKAMAEGDVVEMLRVYQSLKETTG